MKSITFTVTENLETRETIVSPGIIADSEAFENSDELMDNAWLNDLDETLAYRFRVYRFTFDEPEQEAVPASDAMVRALQELVNEDDVSILKVADLVEEGRYTVRNPFFSEGEDEEDDDDWYIPSATAGDYSPSHPWDAPGMCLRDFI